MINQSIELNINLEQEKEKMIEWRNELNNARLDWTVQSETTTITGHIKISEWGLTIGNANN